MLLGCLYIADCAFFLSFLCILHSNITLKSKTLDCHNKELIQHFIPYIMLQCTAMKMAYLTLEVVIISDLNSVLLNLVIIVWCSPENGKTAHPQIPAGRSRSIRSSCWGKASPGTVLSLSSSCMSNMWPAFPPVAAQTTSQTSAVLLGTFQDHPLRSGMFFLPLQLDPIRPKLVVTTNGGYIKYKIVLDDAPSNVHPQQTNMVDNLNTLKCRD